MNTSENYKNKINELRTLIIEDIQEHLVNAKANEVELTGRSIVVGEEDNQFSQTIDRVNNDGLVFSVNFGEEDNVKFDDVSNDNLILVLQKLEQNQFDVYEESEEQAG